MTAGKDHLAKALEWDLDKWDEAEAARDLEADREDENEDEIELIRSAWTGRRARRCRDVVQGGPAPNGREDAERDADEDRNEVRPGPPTVSVVGMRLDDLGSDRELSPDRASEIAGGRERNPPEVLDWDGLIEPVSGPDDRVHRRIAALAGQGDRRIARQRPHAGEDDDRGQPQGDERLDGSVEEEPDP